MWKLKNTELQEQLDGLTKGQFTEELNEKMQAALESSVNETLSSREERRAFNAGFGTVFLGPIEVEDGIEVEIAVSASALDRAPDYDPNVWNVWPDTEPPVDVLMQIEVKDLDQNMGTPEPRPGTVLERGCGHWTGHCWVRPDNSFIWVGDREVRFRPWENTK